ncbi:alkaline phosphatase D family protein, partial [bacterium]|nr:alkaline phosphatase D family protein [bacterium]
VVFEDGTKSQWYNFSTFPEQSQKGQFSFVFSACLRDIYTPHTIFQNILHREPTFVALMGDQIYADYDGDINSGPPTSVLPAFRGKYRRNFDEYLQALSSKVPIVAIWDDHDYGKDNSDNTYSYKAESKRVFKENYPAYPFQVEDAGIYYQFKITDVDIFVLDTRWYRSPMQENDIEGKTMLGEEQLSWLLDGLMQSISPFKIILSSVSLNDYGGDTSSDRVGYDSWMGYKFERNKILSFIKENQISGVMVFSGDQHYPSAHILNWKVPLSTTAETNTSIAFSLSDIGTAVFDFSASPIHYTRATGHKLILGNQNNPSYSHELFRAKWGHPELSDEKLTSVYGFAEVDTKDSTASLSVSFYELDSVNEEMEMLYKVTVENDISTEVGDGSKKFP